jgi:multidrug efflux pump
MEEELGAIQNLQELRSVASPDHATITAVFERGSAPQPAGANVVKAVQRAKEKLPGDAREPEVTDVTHGHTN